MKKKQTLREEIEEALEGFPQHIKNKKKKALARKKFLEKTFGEIVRKLWREMGRP